MSSVKALIEVEFPGKALAEHSKQRESPKSVSNVFCMQLSFVFIPYCFEFSNSVSWGIQHLTDLSLLHSKILCGQYEHKLNIRGKKFEASQKF